jgi:hypothetical protein
MYTYKLNILGFTLEKQLGLGLSIFEAGFGELRVPL